MHTDKKPKPETETIDRLFLELSQFTTARTAAELARDEKIRDIRDTSLSLSWEIEKLPASDRQTRISLCMAALTSRLNELLP